MRPATDVMLANQLNTLPEPAWTPMNAKRENDEEAMRATTGNPLRRVVLNIEGAFPAMARPSNTFVTRVEQKKVARDGR